MSFSTMLEIYLKKLERINVSYVVYHLNHEKEKLIEEYKNEGVYHKEIIKIVYYAKELVVIKKINI